DLVVHHNVGDVYVAPHRVDEVTDADAISVAVAAGYHHIQVVIGQLDPFRHCDRAAMQTVHAIGMKESRQVRCAADARNDHQVFGFDSEPPGRHVQDIEQ